MLASGPAAAAAPAGLPPERARQRCRPVTAECQQPRPATADAAPTRRAGCQQPAQPAADLGRPAAGAEGALETVKKVVTAQNGAKWGTRVRGSAGSASSWDLGIDQSFVSCHA